MLDARQSQRLETLFDQQMFAWGVDVRAEANLLLAHGFARAEPGDGRVSSTYRLTLPSGDVVELSSRGLRWRTGAGAAAALERGPIGPQLAGASAQALAAALRWCAAYERWVHAERGAAWRARALATRTRPPRIDPTAMPTEFEALAEALA